MAFPSPPSPDLLNLVPLPFERLGAADDLHQLLGDGGLPRAVHLEREPRDHVHRVVRRRVHRRHPGPVLPRHRLQQHPEDLRLDVFRQQGGQDLLPGGFVEVVDLRPRPFLLLPLDRDGEQLLEADHLGDGGPELVEHQLDLVEVAREEALHEVPGKLLGVGMGQRPQDVHVLLSELHLAPAEEIAGLAPHREHDDLLVPVAVVVEEPVGRPQQVRVEPSAQAPVRGDHQEGQLRPLPRRQERMAPFLRPAGDRLHDFAHLPGVRPRGRDGVLRPLELRRRHHLHRLGDLLRALDAADPLADHTEIRHRLSVAPRGLVSCRYSLNTPLNSSRAALSFAFTSSSIVFFSRSRVKTAPCLSFTKAASSVSYRPSEATSYPSVYPLVAAKTVTTCCSTGCGSYWACLRISTRRAPRASCICLALSRSDPNWAKAAISRYCASSRRSLPATCFIALICALPPTRETDRPTFTAGRTPA